MRLDSERIAVRRRELGLSQREVARQVGGGNSLVFHLEGDAPHGDLTLRELERLGEALAMDLKDLIAGDPEGAPSRDAGTWGPSLVPELGALLLRVGGRVPLSALAETLECPREQLAAALERLDACLRPCGLQVHLHDATAHLVPMASSDIPASRLTDAMRKADARAHQKASRIRLAYRVFATETTAKKVAVTNPGKVTLGELVNSGIVVRPPNDGGALSLSEDVRYSLLLDEPIG